MPGRAGRNRNRDPFYYWNNTAHTKPEAQALAADLRLEFPAGGQMNTGFKSGIVYVMTLSTSPLPMPYFPFSRDTTLVTLGTFS